MTLALEQHSQATMAEPSPLMGNGLHALAQGHVVGAKRPIAHRHPAAAQHSARPPLAHPERSLKMGDGISTGSGIAVFSKKIPQRRVVQDNVGEQLLEPDVLVLGAFSFLASLASMPPYLAFQQ
jgi:hypothetical protein